MPKYRRKRRRAITRTELQAKRRKRSLKRAVIPMVRQVIAKSEFKWRDQTINISGLTPQLFTVQNLLNTIPVGDDQNTRDGAEIHILSFEIFYRIHADLNVDQNPQRHWHRDMIVFTQNPRRKKFVDDDDIDDGFCMGRDLANDDNLAVLSDAQGTDNFTAPPLLETRSSHRIWKDRKYFMGDEAGYALVSPIGPWQPTVISRAAASGFPTAKMFHVYHRFKKPLRVEYFNEVTANPMNIGIAIGWCANDVSGITGYIRVRFSE